MRQNVVSSLLEELHIESSAWVIEVHPVGFLAFSRCIRFRYMFCN